MDGWFLVILRELKIQEVKREEDLGYIQQG